MARFSNEYQESGLVNVPMERARAYFGDLDRVVANLADLERADRIDDSTMHFYLRSRSAQGITFRGEYRCRWQFVGDDTLEWRTIDGFGNMRLQGRARFTAVGPHQTRIEFHERVETEIDVNRILAAVISPIVSYEMKNGVKRYLERAKRSLESGA